MSKLREKIARILNEEFGGSQKDRLVSMLNSLEFKDDIINAGGEIYAVGGIVRDAVMNTPSDDLDIVVRGIPYDKLFAILSRYGVATDTSHEKDEETGEKDFGATKFKSFNKEFNEYLAANGVVPEIDVMLPRKDAKDPNVKGHKGIKSDVNPMYTIHDDLERRDITINAIAMDTAGNVISNGSGLDDIKNGVIKAVSEDAFIEDPLRMLRAIRFAARYNYKIDANTENLIKNNAGLLSDKAELPKERFLGEFKKMVGKTDLSRAVKLLVDLGMYKVIFGVDSKIKDYSKFDKAESVAEFAYMMFENEPPKTIPALVFDNITNDNSILEYINQINKYLAEVKGKNLDFVKTVNKLADIYRKSPKALLNSTYVDQEHKDIGQKFASGEIPKGEHDVAFKGEEFRNFIVDIITQTKGEFQKSDGRSMGAAKNMALQAIYSGEIKNEVNAIKDFMLKTSDQWIF